MNSLPEQAVDRRVREHARSSGLRNVEQWGWDTYNCLCAYWRDERRWLLCTYHTGMAEGLTVAAITPLLEGTTRCLQCNDEGWVHTHDGIPLGPCDCTRNEPPETAEGTT